MNEESTHRAGQLAEIRVKGQNLNLEQQSEDQLIERGLSGDTRALDTIFARNASVVSNALRVSIRKCRGGPARRLAFGIVTAEIRGARNFRLSSPGS